MCAHAYSVSVHFTMYMRQLISPELGHVFSILLPIYLIVLKTILRSHALCVFCYRLCVVLLVCSVKMCGWEAAALLWWVELKSDTAADGEDWDWARETTNTANTARTRHMQRELTYKGQGRCNWVCVVCEMWCKKSAEVWCVGEFEVTRKIVRFTWITA